MRKHLRSMLSHYWRPIVLKEKCEECGSTNNLEVHHIDAFRQFMYIYNVPENKEELTEEEIKKYEYLCLGYHFKEVRTYTLCNECHKKIHKKEGKTAIKESREITSYILNNQSVKIQDKRKPKFGFLLGIIKRRRWKRTVVLDF